MTYKGKYLQATLFCPWPKRRALSLVLLQVIDVTTFNFEDVYGHLSQNQKTLSLQVIQMLLEVKKKIEKWTARTALIKLEAKQVCT